MSTSAATYNRTLTAYAQGIANDRSNTLADFIAPRVETGIASGQYKKYNNKSAFQVLNTKRAKGGQRNRVELDAESPFFHCQPNGLEIVLDDFESKLAGDARDRLAQGKIRTLISVALTSHEKEVWDKVKAAKSATGSIGNWTNDKKDPVEEIDSQIEEIVTATGLLPNRIAMGFGAWKLFRSHPLVIARQPGAQIVGVTPQQASAMLVNPEIEIRFGTMGYDTAKIGTGKAAANVIGAEVFVFFGQENPDLFDASFAKTFATDASLIDQVREYRDPYETGDVYYTDWTEDVQVTAPGTGRRITIS